MRKPIVGVMGPGEGAIEADRSRAKQLGRSIAERGWIVLTGGRNTGVMDAASRGAKEAGGLTIGVLPSADDRNLSEAVDIAIFTDLGNARNNVNILSSDVVVACGMGLGTASEVALALKTGKPVVLLGVNSATVAFFQQFASRFVVVETANEAIDAIESFLHPSV